jgi:hypothetical protein
LLDDTAHPAPLTEAIQDYVGRSHHSDHADHFAQMAAEGTPSEQTLAFSVLLHLAENDELDDDVGTTVQQTVTDGWDESAQVSALLRAIGYTKIEGYDSQVRQHLENGSTEDVKAAARYAADRLGL